MDGLSTFPSPDAVARSPGRESFAQAQLCFAYLQYPVARLAERVDGKRRGRYEGGVEVCATGFDVYRKASGYVWTDAFTKSMARPRSAQGAPMEQKKSTGIDVARYGAMGALLTSAGDYAKFLNAVMAPKPSGAYRLSEASLREMVRPQVKVSAAAGYSVLWA